MKNLGISSILFWICPNEQQDGEEGCLSVPDLTFELHARTQRGRQGA